MRVGVFKEIKVEEHRVALTPAGARELVARGHQVRIERSSGEGSGFDDEAYSSAGAAVLPDAATVADQSDLILKVKEPLESEYGLFAPRHVVFTYLHLAAAPELTAQLAASGACFIAYETVQTDDGRLPLLAPMSQIAGRLAAQVGAHLLECCHGGKGRLLGGATGVEAARVVVLGAGVSGFNAALIASGMKANVTVLDVNVDRLADTERALPACECLMSSRPTIEEKVMTGDVVVGAVLVAGGRAPVLVPEELVMAMQPGSVIVDIAIDQGGSFATSRPTTHQDPTYAVYGVIHYCVTNMPGIVPATSTAALTNATLPYVRAIADAGLVDAVRSSPALARGVNIAGGRVTNPRVAEATGEEYTPLEDVLSLG